MEEVGRQYLEQRRFIEKELEKRRQFKLQGILNFKSAFLNCQLFRLIKNELEKRRQFKLQGTLNFELATKIVS